MATAVASQPRAAMCGASTSKIYTLEKVYGFRLVCRSVVDLRSQKLHPRISKRKCYFRSSASECEKTVHNSRWIEFRRQRVAFQRSRKIIHLIPLASQDDSSGLSVNGSPQIDSASEMDNIRVKLVKALQNEDISTGLVQSIHDAARSIELAFLDHSKSSKDSWFPKQWLGVDNNEWIKPLSYQAAVGSLLQAVIDVSSRGNGRDRDINVFVQRSLSRLLSSLEGAIQNELSKREPTLYQWYSSDQNPLVVRTFVNSFENDPRFNSATAICHESQPTNTSESDLSLLMLGLTCLAAIIKLGSTKVSCQQFFSMVPDIVGRFMDMLLEFVPLSKAYTLTKDIGLQREFLCNFGPRAADPKFSSDRGVEISFWIDLVQKQLLRALDREKIWSRLTTSESIEVLEKDLAIFGFFIALGRSTQTYLSSNRLTDLDDSINDIVRYLIGGSVLYYPQLSSISSYQLYVEVVCEELEWLPFYSGDTPAATIEGREDMHKGEIISRVLTVCSYWMTSFIKYSSWLENPSNVKAARFLSKGHAMLSDCMKELDLTKYDMPKDQTFPEAEEHLVATRIELASFDKSLESVEEALVKLEDLLQELHLSSSNSGKEDLRAACSDLEMIRRLKKEAEFLEASFRAKTEFLEVSLVIFIW
uniref:LETM1-like protein n=1 Tax=Leersia perrieri TaxID=77586 RepID=A0A0D9X907_9ORYZ